MHTLAALETPAPFSFHSLRATPVLIRWEPSLPIFAKEEFLKAVGDEYGWLGGVDDAGELRCVLPYTIVRKAGLRLVRFRTQTILLDGAVGLDEEKSFLNSVVDYLRVQGADVIIPASNNAIFRTYPDGADAAPYGSYVIDLRHPEDVLWKNVGRITRQNISTARKEGVTFREGKEHVDAAYDLIRSTFMRSKIDFMDRGAFRRFVTGLGEQGRLLMVDYQGVPQSYCLFGFSDACAYAIYAGNVAQQHQGSNKLLYWEAACLFRSLGVHKLDFLGARVNPEKGSKQEGINLMKKRLGASLVEGYMWKYSLRPWRAWPYSVGVRLLRGGDVVDQERHKLEGYRPSC